MTEETVSMSFNSLPELWNRWLNEEDTLKSGHVRRFNGALYYVLKRADFPKPGKSVAHFVAIDENIDVVAVELSVTATPAGPATSAQVLPLTLEFAGYTRASLDSLVRKIMNGELIGGDNK